MSNDAYRKKFPKGYDWKESDGSDHGVEIIGYSEEEYSRILVERNSFLLEKERLEDKVKELETELYFCNRNTRIKETVDSGNNICFETHECNYVYKCISSITKEIVDEG